MKLAWRHAAALLGGLTVFSVSLLAHTRPPSPDGDERLLFDAANRERVARHLPALRWDEKLARAARDHALLMASMGAISHQFPGEQGLSGRISRAGVHFTFAAENVGDAEDAAELHSAWMQSPSHRENLLEKRADTLGIAVVKRGLHTYAVEDFVGVVASLSLEDLERDVGSLLAARGLRVLPTTRDVRQTCALSRGVVPGLQPKYLFRYLTTEVGTLPEQLADEIEKHPYQSAAVGACSATGIGDFAGYRIAVLLY